MLPHHAALGHQPGHRQQGEGGHRQVDEEDPPPGGQVGQHAGDHRSRCPADTGDAAPDSERLHPFPGIGEQQGDQAERSRCGQSLARPLDEPRGDEHGRVDGSPAGGRRRREQGHPEQKQLPPAEDVGHPTAQQEQPTGRQHIAVDYPGQSGSRKAEVMLDARQRHVHHGHIEDEHELDEPQHRQCFPPARVRRRAVGHGAVSARRRRHAVLSPTVGRSITGAQHHTSRRRHRPEFSAQNATERDQTGARRRLLRPGPARRAECR